MSVVIPRQPFIGVERFDGVAELLTKLPKDARLAGCGEPEQHHAIHVVLRLHALTTHITVPRSLRTVDAGS
jgi:hypothetical protein